MIFKNIFFIFVISLMMISPLLASAAGIVPCGGPGEPVCTVCHIFVMLNNIIKFIAITITPIALLFLLIAGGIVITVSGGSKELREKGKSIITTAIVGALLVWCSWLIINTIMSISTKSKSWYNVECSV